MVSSLYLEVTSWDAVWSYSSQEKGGGKIKAVGYFYGNYISWIKDHILFIATHVVSDIESIANEVIFLKKGKIVSQGSVNELVKQYQVSSLEDVYLKLFEDDKNVLS